MGPNINEFTLNGVRSIPENKFARNHPKCDL